MGATRFAAVLLNGKFVRVSDMPKSRYEGREAGAENYKVEVADDAIIAEFYRSNKGNETVEITGGESFCSFDAARRWGASDAMPATCECCGVKNNQSFTGEITIMSTYQVVRGETLEKLRNLEQGGYKVEFPAGIPSTVEGIEDWARLQPDSTNIRFATHNIYPRIRKITVSVQQVHPNAAALAPGPILTKF